MHKVCSLVLALGCINAAFGTEPEAYVTEEDEQVIALADERMHLYCDGSGFKGSVNEGYARSSLTSSIGGDNLALTVFSKAQTSEEIPDVFMEEYGVGWVVKRSMCIMLAVVTLASCLLFCLFSLCRCCAYERPTNRRMKTYAALLIAVVVLGLLICVFRSLSGYWTAHNGLYNAQCTSVTLLDTLLRGEKNGDYRGLVPVLEEFRKAENTLEDNSQFMLGVNQVLDLTDSIRASATLAAETLGLLEEMMEKNRYPQSSSGKDLFHECRFCTAVAAKLEPALKLYRESPAAQLASGREEVRKHLTARNKEEFKKELRENAAKIVEVKDNAIKMISPMLKDDGPLKQAKEKEDLIGGVLLAVVLLASISALILAACAGISVYRFTFHEMDPELEEKGQNPYNKNIHKYAHSTWCCGFFHVFLVLLIAGVIFVVAAPLSSACILMDELDSATMKEIGPALGMGPDSDEAESIPAIIDQCLHPTDGQMESYLLDLLFTTENGQKVTHREKITEAISGSLNPKFASLADHPEMVAPLATAREFDRLASVLGFQQMESMLTGAITKLRQEDDYADAAIPKVGLLEVLQSSIACEDFAVPAEMASQPGEKIPGVNSLKAKLTALGAQDAGGADCRTQVTCSDSGEAYERAACHAANRLIALKKEAADSVVFKCDVFQAPDGSECDPVQMKSEQGLDGVIWSEDCLSPDGTLGRKEKTCTLAEFSAYVQAFEPRIKKVLERVDEQMNLDQPHIAATMTMLMNKHVIGRTDFIANGITCRFFAEHYQELINGFCYQGVYGVRTIAKSYSWCAALSLLLVLSMYAVWCRSKGNIENWKEDRTQYQALLQKEKDAEEARRRKLEKKDGEEDAPWVLGGANDESRRVIAPTTMGPPGRTAPPPAEES